MMNRGTDPSPMNKPTESDSPMESDLPMESEAKLVICSEQPQLVVEQLAALSSIAGYRLLPQDSEPIHDIYFDTPDAQLRQQAMSLRVREIGPAAGADSYRLTLKGPQQPTDWGGFTRLEIEKVWSEDTLKRITAELAKRGISVQQTRGFEPDRPVNVVTALGLIIVQDRSTHRQVRNIIAAAGDEKAMAEMAIDSVTFKVRGQAVHHYELEIEAKQENVSTHLMTIIEALTTQYASILQPWSYGKLLTGKTIEQLSELGSLPELLEGNNLSPAAYAKIEEFLTNAEA